MMYNNLVVSNPVNTISAYNSAAAINDFPTFTRIMMRSVAEII